MNHALAESNLAIPATHRWSVSLAWLLGLAAYAVVIYSGLVEGQAAAWVTNLAWTVSVSFTTIGCFQASRIVDGYLRRAWLLFGAAYTSWLFGQLIWDWNELIREEPVPFPSLSDLFFTGFGMISIVALCALREPSSVRPLTARNFGSLGLIACTVAVALVTALLEPIAQTAHSNIYVTIALIEALAIVFAFLLSLYFLWAHRWGLETAPLILIVLSYAVHAAVALLYIHALIVSNFGASHHLNILWIVSFGLMHLASQAQRQIASGTALVSTKVLLARERRIESLLPGLLLLALVSAAIGFREHLTSRVLAIDAGLIVLFALIMLVRESWIYARERKLKSRLDQSHLELNRAKLDLDATLAELRDLERLLQLAATAGNVGLFEIDLRTNAVHFSPEWKRQLGYAEYEIRDDLAEWHSRIHPDDERRALQWFDEFVRTPNRDQQLETRLKHRDGRYRWILTQGTVSFDDAGEPVTFVGSHVDITRIKETEAALRESEARYRELAAQLENRVIERTAQLQDAYSELESFAYAVSHDLKAPLRAIDGFSHLLVESAQDKMNASEREHLDRVRNGALRMAALIDGLLAYSRVERRELHTREVDLRELLDEVIHEVGESMRGRPLQIECEAPSVKLRIDREALLIVLRNLFDNAVKFTRNVPNPRIEVQVKIGPERLRLHVRDNGIGFDQAYHDQLFSIFQRLNTSGEYEGTGIGLALARKAVQRMNGRLWAESVLGQGATFYVELPYAHDTGGLEDHNVR